MAMRHLAALTSACLVFLGLNSPGCAAESLEIQGPFRGRIVASDTGQPIAGAVILVVWETRARTPLGHGGQAFYDSRETISDADGRFEIARLPIPSERTDVQPPRLYFFAPGYVLPGPNLLPGPVPALAELPGYGEHWKQVVTVTPPDGQRFVAPTVLRMRPITTQQEWCRHAFFLPPLHSMADKMPLTLEAVEKEKRARGRCR